MNQKYPADKPRSYAVLEAEAQAVRRALGFDPAEPLPGLALFESLGRYVVTAQGMTIPLEYAVENLGPGIEAEAKYEQGKVVVSLSDETYSGLEVDHVRYRFTCFHEIAHAVLHPGELVRLSSIPRRTAQAAFYRGDFEDLRPYQDVEWQANGFAAAVSMPAIGLEALARQGRLSGREVADQYSMSLEAATIRVETFQKRRNQLL